MAIEKKVAVIMCIYMKDNPKYIYESVYSILTQDSECDLFLYIDGPVTMDTQYILDAIAVESSITIFYSPTCNGLAYGLNYLIEKVLRLGYDFIARMDADDISMPNRISMQLSFFESNQFIDVCGTYCSEFGASYSLAVKSVPLIHSSLVDYSITRCPFIHPTVMFRASVFKSGSRYPVDTHLTEDLALWFELIRMGFIFGNLPIVLLKYRMDENTIKRRLGLHKGLGEFYLRLKYMMILEKVNPINVVLVFSRLIFHILPISLVKITYTLFR